MPKFVLFSDIVPEFDSKTKRIVRIDSPVMSNAGKISDIILTSEGWRTWASPLLDYQQIGLGTFLGKGVGIIESLPSKQPLCMVKQLVRSPMNKPFTRYEDWRLQMKAILHQLRALGIVHCEMIQDSFVLCPQTGLPLLANFGNALHIPSFLKMESEKARNHLLSVWPCNRSPRHYWTFDMHILLEMAKHPYSPLSEEKLEEIRLRYLTNHPLIESGEGDYLKELESGWCQTMDKHEGRCWEDSWRDIVSGWEKWDGCQWKHCSTGA